MWWADVPQMHTLAHMRMYTIPMLCCSGNRVVFVEVHTQIFFYYENTGLYLAVFVMRSWPLYLTIWVASWNFMLCYGKNFGYILSWYFLFWIYITGSFVQILLLLILNWTLLWYFAMLDIVVCVHACTCWLFNQKQSCHDDLRDSLMTFRRLPVYPLKHRENWKSW